MLIYVAGPYRGDVDGNIAKARAVAAECYLAGHDVICPHMNTAKMDEDTGLPDEFWLNTTLNLLRRCDAVVVVPDWEKSEGTHAELAYAKTVGIPIYKTVPPLHVTEQERPAQVQAFIETLMQMYRVHLSKNADYSPDNILGTGEIGVVVRLMDKMLRLFNLSGFRMEVIDSSYEKPRSPNHEPIEDTLLDLACYSIIGILLRSKKWGK
jgi:nucleoside 2-deoxyribosyltransferase